MTLPIGAPKASATMLKGFVEVDGQQHFGDLVDQDRGAACAYGMLLIGSGYDISDVATGNYDDEPLLTDFFDQITAIHPANGTPYRGGHGIKNLIINLNDTYKWSVPRIANFLRLNLGI